MNAKMVGPSSSYPATGLRPLTGVVLSAVLALVALGCGGGGSSGGSSVATTTTGILTISSGNNQSATVGQSLTSPLVVAATTSSAVALANVTITFTVTSGGGSLSATTATTNASGLAQVTLTVGGTAGTNTVTAAASGFANSPLTFTETATAGAANGATTITGSASSNSQSSGAGAPVVHPLLVTVSDVNSAPVSGAVVTFAVTSGGGSLGSPTATTNALGQAQSTFVLGATPGQNTVTARVAGITASAVFTENGTRLLTPPTTTPATVPGFTSPTAVALVDVNGDGHVDLIVANGSATGTVAVLLGDGAGNFTAAAGSPYAVGAVPTSLAVGDINGDSKPDIVVANTGSAGAAGKTLTLLINQGTAAASLFTATATAPTVGNGPTSVVIGDMNNDNKPDLICANSVDGTFTILLGDGATGTFPASGTTAFTITVGGGVGVSTPSSVAVGALTTGNATNDVVVADGSSANVYVFMNSVATTIGIPFPSISPGGTAVAIGAAAKTVALVDVNGDSKLDLIASSSGTPGSVSVLLGSGTGTFTPATGSPFATGNGTVGLALGNLNRITGSPSIVVANQTDGTISVLLDNLGTYTAGGGQPFATGNGPVAVAIADVNSDLEPDVAIANGTDGTVTILLGQ